MVWNYSFWIFQEVYCWWCLSCVFDSSCDHRISLHRMCKSSKYFTLLTSNDKAILCQSSQCSLWATLFFIWFVKKVSCYGDFPLYFFAKYYLFRHNNTIVLTLVVFNKMLWPFPVRKDKLFTNKFFTCMWFYLQLNTLTSDGHCTNLN